MLTSQLDPLSAILAAMQAVECEEGSEECRALYGGSDDGYDENGFSSRVDPIDPELAETMRRIEAVMNAE
jgi:hypothetical protein